jgi:hypothetical protein
MRWPAVDGVQAYRPFPDAAHSPLGTALDQVVLQSLHTECYAAGGVKAFEAHEKR